MTTKHPSVLYVLCVATLLALAACGDRDAGSAAPEPAPMPAPSAAAEEPLIPPPSREERLRQALADAGATPSERGMVLTLPSAQFDTGTARYEPTDAPAFDRAVELLQAHPDAEVLVVGHTDDRGSAAVNERISLQRAEAVKVALVSRGIDGSRIRVEGAGPSQPVADNRTEEGRSRNRRVELVFPDVEGRLAAAPEAPTSD